MQRKGAQPRHDELSGSELLIGQSRHGQQCPRLLVDDPASLLTRSESPCRVALCGVKVATGYAPQAATYAITKGWINCQVSS